MVLARCGRMAIGDDHPPRLHTREALAAEQKDLLPGDSKERIHTDEASNETGRPEAEPHNERHGQVPGGLDFRLNPADRQYGYARSRCRGANALAVR